MLLFLATLVVSSFIVLIVLLLCVLKYFNVVVRPKNRKCLVGKTAIVTGSNRGIGLEVALALAMRGCRVILACRSNLEETRQKIIEETGNHNIVAMHLDLSSLDSVRTFAKRVNETEGRLDILIHNAVILKTPNKFTEDGLNPVVQVSHFGPFLLTHLLVDLMKKSGPGKIVFVSSFLAYLGNLTLDNLNPINIKWTSESVNQLYNNNKLCNIISAVCFGEKLRPFGITANAVHPGMVKTSVFDIMTTPKAHWIYKFIYALIVVPFAKSPEEGTYAIIDAVTDDRYGNTTGKFLYDRGPIRKPKLANDLEFCRRVWEASEDYVKLCPEERL